MERRFIQDNHEQASRVEVKVTIRENKNHDGSVTV